MTQYVMGTNYVCCGREYPANVCTKKEHHVNGVNDEQRLLVFTNLAILVTETQKRSKSGYGGVCKEDKMMDYMARRYVLAWYSFLMK